MNRNPYAKMKQNSVLTATPQELTLMLYDGAIKFTNIAIVAIENNEIEKAHNNIIKVKNIIREFQVTLNMDYEVSKQFAGMYDYIYKLLTIGNRKKDADALREALGYLRTFRDTWKEAMKIVKQPTQQVM